MIRFPAHSTLLFCSLLGLTASCGEDETVYQQPLGDDAGDTPSTPGPITTSTAPTSVTPTSTGPQPVTPSQLLAAPCTRDVDCGAGLFCLTTESDNWLGGGPSNGFCTADCNAGGDELCMGIDPDSICIGVTETLAYCTPTCLPGDVAATKCQDRPDVACDPITLSDAGIAFCRPMCRGDGDCEGRACDLSSGSCVDELPDGDPIGATCDPNAATNNCTTSFCMSGSTEGTADNGYCTGLCTVGTGGCGSSDGTLAAGDGFCLPAWSGTSVGDLGLCTQSCNCDAECGAENFRCGRYPGASEQLGVEGFCFEFDAEFTEDSGIEFGLTQCPDTDASAADAMSQVDTGVGDADAPDANQSMMDGAATFSPVDGAVDAAD